MVLTDYEQIVTHFSSPMLVLSGPGSGKTHLLADRVVRLLRKGVDKARITVLTYTRDAMDHMRDTLIAAKGHFRLDPGELPRIRTTHSLGLEIVSGAARQVKLRKGDLEVLADDKAKNLLFRDASLILGHTHEDSDRAAECKSRGDCTPDSARPKCRVCAKYREIMRKCNHIDYDDMVLYACDILERDDTLLGKYQEGAQHLLVDEYQDINAAQFRLIDLLSRRDRNGLFVVGDDAQSIYGFRGGDPRFILDFAQDFRGSQEAALACSRRCPRGIMEDAFRVLARYYRQWTAPPELAYHVEIEAEPDVWRVLSAEAEAWYVASLARRFLSDRKTVLILVPNARFIPLLSRELNKAGVRHDCPLELLPKRIRTAQRYLGWLAKPGDNFKTRLVIEELMNTGVAKVIGASKGRRLKPITIEKRLEAEAEIAKLWERVHRKKSLFSVVTEEGADGHTVAKVRDALLGLRESYENHAEDEPGEFLKRLCGASCIWTDPSKLTADIGSIVEMLTPRPATVTGMAELKTMRKAKGLEADVVMIVGLEDDIVPGAAQGREREEQARLFYVAMTRAREKLFLFHSYSRRLDVSYGDKVIERKRSAFLDATGRSSTWKMLKMGKP